MLSRRTHLPAPPQPRALGTPPASGALAAIGRGGDPRGQMYSPSSRNPENSVTCAASRGDERAHGGCARSGSRSPVLRPGPRAGAGQSPPARCSAEPGRRPGDPAAAAPGLRARVTAARLLKGAAADPAPAPAWRGFEPLPEWAGPRGPWPAAEPILGGWNPGPGKDSETRTAVAGRGNPRKAPSPGKERTVPGCTKRATARKGGPA